MHLKRNSITRKNNAYLVLLIYSFLFIGCKEEEQIQKENQLQIDSNLYSLSTAVLLDFGLTSTGSDNYILYIHSSSMSFSSAENSLVGIGDGISVNLFSENTENISTGEYIFKPGSNGESGTFDEGAAFASYDFLNSAGTVWAFSEGSLNISLENGEYLLELSAKGKTGEVITAYYKGTVYKINY